MNQISENSIKIEKKDAMRGKVHVLGSMSNEIKKLIEKQIKILINKFESFAECKSAKNCELWESAAYTRMKTLTSNLIRCFDDMNKLKKLINSFSDPNRQTKFSQVIEITRDKSMTNLGISDQDLNNLVEKVYTVLLESVIKFKDLKNESEKEEQIIFDEFYQKFGDLLFGRIYKNDRVHFVVKCEKIPEYEFVGEHPSCKIHPDDECCYYSESKSDITKRSIDENLGFLPNDNLEMQNLVLQTNNDTLLSVNNSWDVHYFAYLTIFLPIIFILILICKKLKT